MGCENGGLWLFRSRPCNRCFPAKPVCNLGGLIVIYWERFHNDTASCWLPRYDGGSEAITFACGIHLEHGGHLIALEDSGVIQLEEC